MTGPPPRAAPFKLTRELLEVMDSNSEGRPSELFDYFKAGPAPAFPDSRIYHAPSSLFLRCPRPAPASPPTFLACALSASDAPRLALRAPCAL